MGELIRIAIKVEELGDAVGLAEGRVDIHVSVAAASREVLVLQFAKRHDLNDGLRVGPPLNGALVTRSLAKDDQMSLTLAANEKLALLACDLH